MRFQSRKVLMSCVLVLAGLGRMSAQTVEVFGGYTLNNMKTEGNVSHATASGWNTSVTDYFTPRLGITADFAGYYSTLNPLVTTNSGSTYAGGVPSASFHQYSFMAGPQFRLLRTQRLETSVRALFGGARGYLPDPIPAYNAFDQTTFASLIGSNFDVNISKRMAVRFSPGLYITQFNGETQKDFRFSVGPVFRFGGGEK